MIWKLLLRFFNIFSVILLVWLLWGKHGKQRPATILSDGRVEFLPDQLAFFWWLSAVVPSTMAAIKALQHGFGKPTDLLTTGVVGLIALSHLASFPGSVVVTREGIEQVYWFRGNKRIRWENIEEIDTGDKRLRVTITGKDRTRIVHSGDLADRPRLLLELKQHCADNLPPDFPREPMTEIVSD